ncbi:Protein required for biogenesis of the ribosomal 60S subunit [Trachipleistophora hominis]|uniref:Ribosome production factor 2 homolog n=1 Tax=Trachipleistophora hominis TaxID=72359 RepID=L7JY40_TRAHO|nr:Protein required for biogenesis of the ribosomal 60S subunit [Trachipleistophora hominis]
MSNLSSQIQLSSTLYQDLYALDSVETLIAAMRKRKCNIFLNESGNKLAVGRIYEDEVLDIIEYEIIEKKGFVSGGTALGSKYLMLFLGLSERERNLWTDVLYQRSSQINLDAIMYVFVLTRQENEFVLSLCTRDKLELVGPFYKLKVMREKYCDSALFKTALGTQKPKKMKNVTVDEQKTKVGKVYVNKQDFKDLRLKKGIFKSKN